MRIKNLRTILFIICQLWAISPLMAQAKDSDKKEDAIKALQQVTIKTKPDALYSTFNEFCRHVFGAEQEPLVYKQFGENLIFLEKGHWMHVSENSVALAFESNLPSTSIVTFGETSSYGKVSKINERPYYLHLHYLRNLKAGTSYHYKIELTDERGNTIRSKNKILKTKAIGKAIYIPGDLKGPPYRLEKNGASYILQKDLITKEKAIIIVGDNITLDLNGHSVRFGEGAQTPIKDGGVSAIGHSETNIPYMSTNTKILNGTIIQGNSEALNKNTKSEFFTPLFIKGDSAEVAGITIEYHGPQIWGMNFYYPTGDLKVHHNVILDKGAVIKNRHGAATRSIGFRYPPKTGNQFKMHHNLVKRTRQNGIGGTTSLYNNEIYVDSFSTNSFATQAASFPGVNAGEHHHNRIFGTGFNVYGFGWAHEDYKVHHNLVHFQGILVNHRWHESWGDMSTLEGMRVTNYGKGGQVRNNLHYFENLVVIKGRGGSELRGTGFFSDTSIKNLIFRDNIVKVIAEDEKTQQVSCITAHGHTNKTNALPVLYKNNTLIGNRCIIRFGDSYGKGHNHHFIANKLIRTGNLKKFHTIELGGAYTTAGHKIIDSDLGEGVSLENVFWQRTGHKSNYAIGHSLNLKGKAGSKVVIKDKTNTIEFEGKIPSSGVLDIPLTNAIIHPATWPKGGEAKNSNDLNKELKTPHSIHVEGYPSKTITMNEKKSLQFN